MSEISEFSSVDAPSPTTFGSGVSEFGNVSSDNIERCEREPRNTNGQFRAILNESADLISVASEVDNNVHPRRQPTLDSIDCDNDPKIVSTNKSGDDDLSLDQPTRDSIDCNNDPKIMATKKSGDDDLSLDQPTRDIIDCDNDPKIMATNKSGDDDLSLDQPTRDIIDCDNDPKIMATNKSGDDDLSLDQPKPDIIDCDDALKIAATNKSGDDDLSLDTRASVGSGSITIPRPPKRRLPNRRLRWMTTESNIIPKTAAYSNRGNDESSHDPSDRRTRLQRSSTLRRSAITSSDLTNSITHKIISLELSTGGKDWIRSFRDLDPRHQILEFFNELSMEGMENFESQGCRTKGSVHMPKVLRYFIKFGIFSVWRPTSPDAIAKMITGEGTGKGLEIKGKSAKCGQWSGFVPFLQIHDNKHKKLVGNMRKDKRVRVFYPNQSSREMAASVLADVGKDMTTRAKAAEQKVEKEHEKRAQNLDLIIKSRRPSLVDTRTMDEALRETNRCLMDDPFVYEIDNYFVEGIYGLDIPEKLFWESYVAPNDISRPNGSKLDTGRPSMPEFQQMNLETLRNWGDKLDPHSDDTMGDILEEGRNEADLDAEADPRPVLWHGGCGRVGEEPPEDYNPMCPLGLLMAYEENDKVTPVVSDFDCFLLGTRGVKYSKPFGKQELSMLSSCVEEIEGILATPIEGSDWTTRWLEVKKKHANNGTSSHQMPKFGYADPLSYSMMTGAVHHMKSNGAVRHGPECFNYGFPQELDDKYLVISDTFPGVPWRYTNGEELVDILSEKVDEGFTFPLNPKWILCDPGWKKVYDKLLASSKPNVQNSLDIWYPDEIRKRISDISTRFPQGFITSDKDPRCSDLSSGVRFDLAILELKRHKIRLSSRRKLREALTRRSLGCGLGSERMLYRELGTRLLICSLYNSVTDGQSNNYNNAFLKAVQVVQEEDHTVNKKDDRTGSNKEYRPLKQRRSSSITFDILRESTGSAESALAESFLSDSMKRDYATSGSCLDLETITSDSDEENPEDSDVSEAIPPSIRSSAPLEIDSLGNSLADSSNHSVNISDGESDCTGKGSDDANTSKDSRPRERRRSSASLKIKALKNRLSRGSNRKRNHSNGESEGDQRDSEDANDSEATQSQRRLMETSSLLSPFNYLKRKLNLWQ